MSLLRSLVKGAAKFAAGGAAMAGTGAIIDKFWKQKDDEEFSSDPDFDEIEDEVDVEVVQED